MRVVFDAEKSRANLRNHGLGLELAQFIFRDPLVTIVYDRFEAGEHRYHAIGIVGSKCLLVVHTNPDADDDGLIRAISLREATREERRRYEEGDFD